MGVQLSDNRIRRIIAEEYEGNRREFKRELDFDDIDHRIKFVKEVVSLANSGGGHLIFGVIDQEDADNRVVGMDKSEVPDESELNDLADKYINDSITLEMRHFSHRGENCPTIYVEETNFPLIISQHVNGNSKQLHQGTIYWRDGGSAKPLTETNHIINFLSRFDQFGDEKSKVSPDEFVEQKKPGSDVEELVTNLLPVENLPDKVYLAEEKYHRKSRAVRELIDEVGVPRRDFILWNNKVVTFANLEDEDCDLKHIIKGPVAEKDFSQWREQQEGKHDIYLLNACFNDYCGFRGLEHHPETQARYFTSRNTAMKKRWYPGTSTTRHVVHRLDDVSDADVIFAHKGLIGEFTSIGGEFYFSIESKWVGTYNGVRNYVRQKKFNKLSNKLQRREQNWQYLQTLRFWTAYLGDTDGRIKMGDSYSVTLGTTPVSTEVNTGTQEDYVDEFSFKPDKFLIEEVEMDEH